MKMSAIHATATTMTLAKSKINDDKMEIENWFKGFEKGLERLSPEQRSVFFSECGRNCVNGGTLSVYQQLYERAQGDMDTFFHMVNELPGVRGGVVEKGRVYRLVFLECTCKLCIKGYVTRDLFAAMSVERETLHSDALPFHLAWRNRLRNENRGWKINSKR